MGEEATSAGRVAEGEEVSALVVGIHSIKALHVKVGANESSHFYMTHLKL